MAFLRDPLLADNRLWHCEVLVLPLSGNGTTIDMLISGLIWL